MVSRVEAINNFLQTQKVINPLWHSELETQVLVHQGTGEIEGRAIIKNSNGKRVRYYTNDVFDWCDFRIPHKADSEPEDNSGIDQKWPLDKLVSSIGSTGWNWVKRQSEWLGYDFDAIAGHKTGLDAATLEDIIKRVSSIEWVTAVRSTGGRGFHFFIHLNPFIETANHNEHAALARAILGLLSAKTGFDFSSKVDCVGGNMWLWSDRAVNIVDARLTTGKFKDLEDLYATEESLPFKVIKHGIPLGKVPLNWKDHVNVISGKKRRVSVTDNDKDFDALCSSNRSVPLEDEHLALVDWLDNNEKMWWFDNESQMIVCHTADLAEAHKDLGCRGIFRTKAEGKESGNDQNCFAYPLPGGSWVVRRHSKGCQEDPYWDLDSSGWTRCYFNRMPEFKTVIRSFNGLPGSKGDYEFSSGKQALIALDALGHKDIDMHEMIAYRQCILKLDKGNLLIRIPAEKSDNKEVLMSWRLVGGKHWEKIVKHYTKTKVVETPDDIVRAVMINGDFESWYFMADDRNWGRHPSGNVIKGMKAAGYGPAEIDLRLGKCVKQPWEIVNEPFQPEYIGGRKWNKNSAQLAYTPAKTRSGCPTWEQMLYHVGTNLKDALDKNQWCNSNGIKLGGDYLYLWVASLFQKPKVSLPYLFFWSTEENTGKSSFHTALGSLFVKGRGYVKANNALTSSGNFNGELDGCILACIEEINLSASKSALEKIKDYVTSEWIDIQIKMKQTYMTRNYLHFVQCANDPTFFPLMPGDTRVTMIEVPVISRLIGTEEFKDRLSSEAPAFLYKILNMDIPPYIGRLSIPVIDTVDKLNTAEGNARNSLDFFIEDNLVKCDGSKIKFETFFRAFVESLSPMDRHTWSSMHVVGRKLPKNILRGKYGPDNLKYIANYRWADEQVEPTTPWVLSGEKLVK